MITTVYNSDKRYSEILIMVGMGLSDYPFVTFWPRVPSGSQMGTSGCSLAHLNLLLGLKILHLYAVPVPSSDLKPVFSYVVAALRRFPAFQICQVRLCPH